VKPGKVKNLDPDGSLAANAEKVVSARLDELWSFVPDVLNPANVEELHEMRIAAKRLRYVLEVTAETCFGPYAVAAEKRIKRLQDLLGEIHDCDVQYPRVDALRRELEGEAASQLREMAQGSADLDPGLVASLEPATEERGLVTLATYLRARRELLYDQFMAMWNDLERDGLRARLKFALSERPNAAANGLAQPVGGEGLG
jgi:hypothetical protein